MFHLLIPRHKIPLLVRNEVASLMLENRLLGDPNNVGKGPNRKREYIFTGWVNNQKSIHVLENNNNKALILIIWIGYMNPFTSFHAS